MLAADPRWRGQRVVRRLAAEVLPLYGDDGDPAVALTLSDEHAVPHELIDDVHAVLGA
jgi:hypothetical protein